MGIAWQKASTTTWKVIYADTPINIALRTKAMKVALFNLDGVLQCAQTLPATVCKSCLAWQMAWGGSERRQPAKSARGSVFT